MKVSKRKKNAKGNWEYLDQTEQSFAFEINSFIGLDLNQFDDFLENREGIWEKPSGDAKECIQELILLRHQALDAYSANKIELAMAYGKAMRWLAEYTNYRWSVHDVAHKGHRMISAYASNRKNGNKAKNEFTSWQQSVSSQLQRNGKQLTDAERVKKFKIAKRPLADRKTRRLNKLLKAGRIPLV